MHNEVVRAGRAKGWRAILSLIVLLTFGPQSFLVQTHIHNLLNGFSTSKPVAASHAPKAPLDTGNCLLCQEYTHSGTYLTPNAIAALPPMAIISLLPLVLVPLATTRTLSHAWQGRAPPHV